MSIEAKTATQVQYGTIDVNRLKGLKPFDLDLNGFWSRVKQTDEHVLSVLASFSPSRKFNDFDTNDFMLRIPTVTIPKFVISDEIALKTGGELWREKRLDVNGSVNKTPDLAGVFLAVCSAGANLSDEEWSSLLLKENKFRFRSSRVRQFAYVAGKYEVLKSRFVEVSGENQDNKQLAALHVRQMEQDIVKALEV